MKKYVCDFCGEIICNDIKAFGAIRGYRYCIGSEDNLYDKQKIDLCVDCAKMIRALKKDKSHEQIH